VRFDDSSATVADDDGNVRSRSDLRLGMMVEIDAGQVNRAAASALARRIRWAARSSSGGIRQHGCVHRAGAGPDGAVTPAPSSTTRFRVAWGPLEPGQVVEVHGILDPANGRVVATRIEAEDAAAVYKLRGAIDNLDTTARTFTINGALISYAGLPAAMVPPGLTKGQIVRVLLQTGQADGVWLPPACAAVCACPRRAAKRMWRA